MLARSMWSPPVTSPGRLADAARGPLAFFDDVRGDFRCVAAADVLHRVRYFRRDEQHIAGLERHRRPALERVLQQTFDDIDELFARMRVIGERTSWANSTSTWITSRPGTLRSFRIERCA